MNPRDDTLSTTHPSTTPFDDPSRRHPPDDPLSTTQVVWQDRKHGEKVRLESHFDRVDVNSVDKSGESIIVTKS